MDNPVLMMCSVLVGSAKATFAALQKDQRQPMTANTSADKKSTQTEKNAKPSAHIDSFLNA
jgi:hypothetical protein